MTFDLRVLNYSSPVLDDRFDSLIAQAMLDQEPRLRLRVEHRSPVHGSLELLCGATYSGLVGDCFVVEDSRSAAFKVVDYQDCDASPAVVFARSTSFHGALYTMFHGPRIKRLFGDKRHLVKPGWFLDQYPRLTSSYRDKVRSLRARALDPRLLFRGTILNHASGQAPYAWNKKLFRQVAVVLLEKYPDEVDISDAKLPREAWFLKAAAHRIVLALPGHPWCYREFELFNLGIPVLSYPWHTHVEGPALPLHYVATRDLSREEPGFASDPEEGADAIIAAYRAAIKDPERLESTALQAQQWYDRVLNPAVIAGDVLTFLNLDGEEWNTAHHARGALASAN